MDEIETFGTFIKGDATRVADTVDTAVKLVYEGWVRVEDETPAPQPTGAPPKTGAGSGREHWAEYAGDHGLTVTDEQGRDEIIAALESAGITTEHSL